MMTPSEMRANTEMAFFTGNPKYYSLLMQLNKLMRAYNLPFQDGSLYSGQQLPRWMSRSDMEELKHFKLTSTMYKDLIHKLNSLYSLPFKDNELEELLLGFVRPGDSLTPPETQRIQLDEFGRSHTRGSRKSARAQCWMVKGEGQIMVNGIPMAEYFPEFEDRERIIKAFQATKSLGKYNVWAVVAGGGLAGQASAISVAVARGLVAHDPIVEEILKPLAMLRIDTRQVERKKTGQPGARKKKSWVKR